MSKPPRAARPPAASLKTTGASDAWDSDGAVWPWPTAALVLAALAAAVAALVMVAAALVRLLRLRWARISE